MLYSAVFSQYQRQTAQIMATAKTTTLTFRIEPNLKDALCTAADRDHRSIANMIEVMIRNHCSANGIAIAELGTGSRNNKKAKQAASIKA